MNWLPEDVKDATGGETIDNVARDSIRLAHKALDRFPDLVRRHKVIAGGAAISSSLVILAGVAITKRMRSGQTGEEAVAGLTEDELQHLERVKTRVRVEVEASPEATNGVSEEIPPARID